MRTRRAAALLALLAPTIAYAQSPFTYTNRAGTGPAGLNDPIKLGEATAAGRGKVDTEQGALHDPAITGNTVVNGQSEAIGPGVAGVSTTYLGGPTFPQRNSVRINLGHLAIVGPTGSWGSQTDMLSIEANCPDANDGNQGGFWDPNYRTAYGGQDGAGLFVLGCGRPPIAKAVAATYGTSTIRDSAGNARTVYTAVLATPLTAAQILALSKAPVNTKLETGTAFSGYLIPSGFKDMTGNPVPPVSADGKTLVVDNWVNAATNVPASAGASPPAGDLLNIDILHQIDNIYGGWRVTDSDVLTSAINIEQANSNARTGILPPLNLYDPQASNPFLVGRFDGVSGPPNTQAAGVAHDLCTTGWQACFVARNNANAQTGLTFGFLAPFAGPTWAFYSTQGPGSYLLASDPYNTCQPTHSGSSGAACSRPVLLDVMGNMGLAGALTAGSVTSTGPLTVSGAALLQGGAQTNGPLNVYTTVGGGRTLSVDNNTGNTVTNGFIATGNGMVTVDAAAASCNASQFLPGAHLYLVDGRKPGEAAGAGSGVPADCTAPTKGGSFTWVSTYDHLAVVK